MCTLGATRAARACRAWARPISPPSAVTAALFDMFCGLNGRTARPRAANARARPATIRDLPTSEPVPWNMSPRAGMFSELDARLRLHAGGKVVLHQRHLGDKIRGGNKLRLGVAAGDDDVQALAACGERGNHGAEIEIVVAQRNVELVENDEGKARIGHEFARLRPGALGGRDIARAVLRVPGEALAHRVPGDLIAEADERVALGRMPRALDELHDADAVAASEHAQGKAEGRGRFSLAGAGVHDEETLLDRLSRHLGVLHRLAFRHLGAVALGFGLVGRFGHDVSFAAPFTASGRPATMSTTRSAPAASRWLRVPCRSRKRRPSGWSGTMPEPTSFATRTTGAA